MALKFIERRSSDIGWLMFSDGYLPRRAFYEGRNQREANHRIYFAYDYHFAISEEPRK